MIFGELLAEELKLRQTEQTRYSQRRFASDLAIDSGTLSRLISGKQTPSLTSARRILTCLGVHKTQVDLVLNRLVEQKSCDALTKIGATRGLKGDDESIHEIDIDTFSIVSDVIHYAILELTYTGDFSPDSREIAKRLGVSQLEVRPAIDRLVRCGLLLVQDGKLVKTNHNITTKNKNISTRALRKHQRQVLQGAIEALTRDPIEMRSNTSFTMAIDELKLPVARKMIADFTHQLSAFLETGERREVYQIGISLYPMTHNRSEV